MNETFEILILTESSKFYGVRRPVRNKNLFSQTIMGKILGDKILNLSKIAAFLGRLTGDFSQFSSTNVEIWLLDG